MDTLKSSIVDIFNNAKNKLYSSRNKKMLFDFAIDFDRSIVIDNQLNSIIAVVEDELHTSCAKFILISSDDLAITSDSQDDISCQLSSKSLELMFSDLERDIVNRLSNIPEYEYAAQSMIILDADHQLFLVSEKLNNVFVANYKNIRDNYVHQVLKLKKECDKTLIDLSDYIDDSFQMIFRKCSEILSDEIIVDTIMDQTSGIQLMLLNEITNIITNKESYLQSIIDFCETELAEQTDSFEDLLNIIYEISLNINQLAQNLNNMTTQTQNKR